MWMLGIDLGHLEKQPMFLTTEMSLQPQTFLKAVYETSYGSTNLNDRF